MRRAAVDRVEPKSNVAGPGHGDSRHMGVLQRAYFFFYRLYYE
jgi:hypothetical protein